MQPSSRVAIVLATYNGEAFLQEQLDAIAAQTFKDFTLYIADDASSDKTVKIIEAFIARVTFDVQFWRNTNRLGYVKNFEQLLLRCYEPYIALCDQDDWWQPYKLLDQLNAMRQLERDNTNLPLLVHSDLRVIDEDGNKVASSYFRLKGYALKQKKDVAQILGPCGVMGNTMLMNRQLITHALPFPSSLDNHDYYLAIHAELFGKRKTLSQTLVSYRIHHQNSSNNKEQLLHQPFLKGCFGKLPNLSSSRKHFLPQILKKVSNPEDRVVLQHYINYLNRPCRWVNFFILLKYGLVKRGIKERLLLFCKFLFRRCS